MKLQVPELRTDGYDGLGKRGCDDPRVHRFPRVSLITDRFRVPGGGEEDRQDCQERDGPTLVARARHHDEAYPRAVEEAARLVSHPSHINTHGHLCRKNGASCVVKWL